MKYYSINRQAPLVGFREATVSGQAPDKGLYFPQEIPRLDKSFIQQIDKYDQEEIAFHVIRPFVGDSIPENTLRTILNETVNFAIPLLPIDENIYCLETFHGNTLAFKDVGARFMSRCLGHFVKGSNKKITVLVATSGDTGGAVADGFHNVEGVEVVILYPSGKVSMVQELQLTTPGENIHAIEVLGTFDDCQHIVKQAFHDKELNEKLVLTSANSINVARWLPQQFFYFFAYRQWPKETPLVISVPSGNFGNICAGLLAKKTGLPIHHFIAACNANDAVPAFLHNGSYKPHASVATISNAMDVGDPSNLNRILELFDNNLPDLKKEMTAVSIGDKATKESILHMYGRFGYLPDPHGAVGYTALQQYLQHHPGEGGIFLETAHPVKFFDIIEPLLNIKIPFPTAISNLLHKPGKSTRMEASFDEIKSFLMLL